MTDEAKRLIVDLRSHAMDLVDPENGRPDVWSTNLLRKAADAIERLSASTERPAQMTEEERTFAEWPVTIWQVLDNGKINPTEMVCLPRALRDRIAAILASQPSGVSAEAAEAMKHAKEHARIVLNDRNHQNKALTMFEASAKTLAEFVEGFSAPTVTDARAEAILQAARDYAYARQSFPISKFEERIEDAGWRLAEAIRKHDSEANKNA